MPLGVTTVKRPWALALAVLLCVVSAGEAQTQSATDRRILFYQAQVKKDPDYWTSYNQLASAYVLKSRETGDISYLELAEASLDKSLALESTHADAASAFTGMAIVHLSEHRFEQAATDAGRAIALYGERDATAYPYAADAQLELGNYAAAQKLFDRLRESHDGRPHPDLAFLALSHGAGLHWILGDDKLALDEMRRAVAMAEEMHLPAENIAWTHFMLGEQMFQAGDLSGAEKEEDDALAAFPRYNRALAEMGRIRAAQHRLDDAVTFYKQALAIIPLPVYAAALGDVYTAMGDKAAAQKQYALVEYIAKLSALSQRVFNRELALFYADHDRQLRLAVFLANLELTVRADIYSYDALAWAIFKNGDAGAARRPMESALRFGTKDALLEYHAGKIFAKLGERDSARKHFETALALNPAFHVLYAADARRELAALREEPAVAK